MGALSSLLMLKPSDESLQNAWVSSVLPLAADPEQTCQVHTCTRSIGVFFNVFMPYIHMEYSIVSGIFLWRCYALQMYKLCSTAVWLPFLAYLTACHLNSRKLHTKYSSMILRAPSSSVPFGATTATASATAL